MVELVDTRDLKSLEGNFVPVQVRLWAPFKYMKKEWIIALYKINEINRLEKNLSNQGFNYYLPKITTKKANSIPEVEILFPGYIFINTTVENYSALKYTKGMKKILTFGNKISYLSNDDIEAMQIIEKTSKSSPVSSKVQIGQDVLISKGSLRGSIAKICSLPSRERVEILLYFLGSFRRVSVSEKDIIF